MVSAVELLPAPANTLTRPRFTLRHSSMARRRSAGVMVTDSPVVPMGMSTDVPCCT
jgi:hypothetical protein